jgi:hypothetical protein
MGPCWTVWNRKKIKPLLYMLPYSCECVRVFARPRLLCVYQTHTHTHIQSTLTYIDIRMCNADIIFMQTNTYYVFTFSHMSVHTFGYTHIFFCHFPHFFLYFFLLNLGLEKKVPTPHSLFFTFLLGPLGLTLHLVTR